MKGQEVQRIISLLLTVVGVIALLGVVEVESAELPGGEMAKQFHYLWQAAIVFVVCLSATLFLNGKYKPYKYPDFYYAVVWGLIILGGIEAVFGLRQLYGFTISNHSLYSMTGSFFNPGPYSGYLAMVFPLCLHEWLILRKNMHLSWLEVLGKYLSLATMLMILCLLPAGMSRSAWIAVFISGVWVYGMHANWGIKLNQMWMNRKKVLSAIGLVTLMSLLVVAIAMFHLKKDSASGRLLMWKVSCHAIVEKPLTGYGHGNFAKAYGAAQENYFAKGDFSSQEELVAGSPEYAFNEYLQLGVERGIPMLLTVLVLAGYCLFCGVRAERWGVCGAVVSLMVFAFASYPMQLPVFVISLGALLLACTVGQRWPARSGKGGLHGRTTVVLILIGGSVGVYSWKADVYEECKSWNEARMFYHTGAYEKASGMYESLYPALRQRGTFLFEYGHCLHKMKQYDSSTQIMQEAMSRTCDPMVLNIIGKNYQEQGEYAMAEHWLIRSTHLLPGRIYPYYLLAKLYAEPDFYQPGKLKAVAEIVMTKEPKVQSTAIRQMRNEIMKLIKEPGL